MKSFRLQKLNERLTQEGVQGVFDWAARWMYWNGGGVHVARTLGRAPKKFGIRNPIVVYQMGKVGSTSVYYSLKRLELGVPLYHLHYLNELDYMAEVSQRRTPAQAAQALQLIKVAKEVRAEMARHPNKKWNFISLTRLPVPRLISAFFENIENHFPNPVERYERGELGISEVTDYFVHRFGDHTPRGWFQRQLQEPFGLDVYAVPFDKTRGYQIYHHQNLSLLLVRLEDLNQVATQAMYDFLGIPEFRLVNRNVGETKRTGNIHGDFLKALCLPRDWVTEWHSTQYAQHFYTPQELEQSIASWV